MTRNEALKKIENVIVNSSDLLDAIEALGLIKFDDVERVWYQSENSDIWGTVRISEYNGALHLWIGGRHRFALKKEDMRCL
jgi:hypothetical protein